MKDPCSDTRDADRHDDGPVSVLDGWVGSRTVERVAGAQGFRRRLAEDVFAGAPRILTTHRAEQTRALIARIVQETEAALSRHMSATGVGIGGPEHFAVPGGGPDSTFALLRDGGLLADTLVVERAVHRVIEAEIAKRRGDDGAARVAALLEQAGLPARHVRDYLAERGSGVAAGDGPRLALASLPFERACALVWSVAASLRYRILAVAPIDPSTLDDRIENAATVLLSALAACRTRMDAAQSAAERMDLAPEEGAAFAAQALSLGAYDLCEVVLAWALAAARIVVRRVMFHDTPEDIALLCHGAGMRERDARVVLETILPVRDDAGAEPSADTVDRALAAVRAASGAALEGAMHYWSLKPDYADGLCAIHTPEVAPGIRTRLT